jgi:hypothetical protein
MQVKYLFLVLVDLCKRTAEFPYPMPKSQVGTSQPTMRLHYVDGEYSVTPDVVEAALGPHVQVCSTIPFMARSLPLPLGKQGKSQAST